MSDEATFWRMEAERHAPGSCGRCRDPYCAGDHETADPFSGIPDLNSGYAGTVLETSAEREQRAAEACPACGHKAHPETPGECSWCPEGYCELTVTAGKEG